MSPITSSELRKGYIALISVILIGALGTAVMVSVIASGVSATKTDYALQQGGGGRALASSCVEEALQKIVETGTSSSTGNLSLGQGTCSYVITSQNGQNIKVNATGILSTITTKIQVLIATTSPAMTLSSWQEVVDF